MKDFGISYIYSYEKLLSGFLSDIFVKAGYHYLLVVLKEASAPSIILLFQIHVSKLSFLTTTTPSTERWQRIHLLASHDLGEFPHISLSHSPFLFKKGKV